MTFRGLQFSILLFFLCGFTAALNFVLIPYLQTSLDVSYTLIACIPLSFYFAYLIFSPIAGAMIPQSNYLKGIRGGILTAGIGTLLICFASITLFYPLILTGIFVLGAGIAILQVTVNPYALLMGPKETASSRLSLAQAFTSLGTIVAPCVGSYFLFSTLEDRSLQLLYFGLALVWVGALGVSYIFLIPQGKEEHDLRSQEKEGVHPLKDPFVIFGCLAIATAVGIEVTVGSHLVKYLSDSDVAGISMNAAGNLMMLYWFGFFIGRTAGSVFLKRISAEQLMFRHAIVGVFLTSATFLGRGYVSAVSALALGVCVSVMFPVIFNLVLDGCRTNKEKISGYLCMANVGGALFPLIQGVLADNFGLFYSFLLPFVGFLYLVFYALYIKHYREKLACFSHT